MAEIWRTHDRVNRQVVLTAVRQDHILLRHADMAGRLAEVKITVEHPDSVARDKRYPHRENHYRRTPPEPGWIQVVVHYRPVPPQGTWAGEVITAYYVEQRDFEEVSLWP